MTGSQEVRGSNPLFSTKSDTAVDIIVSTAVLLFYCRKGCDSKVFFVAALHFSHQICSTVNDAIQLRHIGNEAKAGIRRLNRMPLIINVCKFLVSLPYPGGSFCTSFLVRKLEQILHRYGENFGYVHGQL